MSNSDAFLDPSPPPGGRGCRPGCLIVGFIAAMAAGVLVVVMGVGLPCTYWHRVGNLQVFEGPDSVVLFVEVQLATRRPGLIQSPPVVVEPSRLLQIEVAPQRGAAKTTVLKSDDFTSFNMNIAPIIRLPDAFYVVVDSPRCLLERIHEGRAEPHPLAESRAILQSAGVHHIGWRDKSIDRVSERNGWRRLNQWSTSLPDSFQPIESKVHPMRIWCGEEKSGAMGMIWAESTAKEAPWVATLVTVNTKRWRSYEASPRTRAHR